MSRQFYVVIERGGEGYYVTSVPQLSACHTQGRSLDEVTERIREAIELFWKSRERRKTTWNSSEFSASSSRHDPDSPRNRP